MITATRTARNPDIPLHPGFQLKVGDHEEHNRLKKQKVLRLEIKFSQEMLCSELEADYAKDRLAYHISKFLYEDIKSSLYKLKYDIDSQNWGAACQEINALIDEL